MLMHHRQLAPSVEEVSNSGACINNLTYYPSERGIQHDPQAITL